MHFPRWLIITILFCSTTIPATGIAAGTCSLQHPADCATTNTLVWSRGFKKAVTAFIGDIRTGFLYGPAPLADQMLAALGGPPSEPVTLGDGSYLFAACRAHSCPEKGALVVDSRGRIRAMAILSYHIEKTDQVDQRYLDIYTCPNKSHLYATALSNWAFHAVEKETESYPEFSDPLAAARVAIHTIHTPPCLAAS